jgi:hypothetical protein
MGKLKGLQTIHAPGGRHSLSKGGGYLCLLLLLVLVLVLVLGFRFWCYESERHVDIGR